MKSGEPVSHQIVDDRRRWLLVAAAGVAVGLGIAWLLVTVL